MLAWMLSGCVFTVYFPPDLWVWDSAWDTGGPDRGGSGAEEPEPEPEDVTPVAEVSWGCDPENTAWTWTVRIDEWTSQGTLDLIRTGDGASEQHDLVLASADPSGSWDERRAGPLADATPPESQVANTSTRFDCEADADGKLIDCVVGGADPTGVTVRIRELDPAVVELGGCRRAPGS
jgi:hypothetical protein